MKQGPHLITIQMSNIAAFGKSNMNSSLNRQSIARKKTRIKQCSAGNIVHSLDTKFLSTGSQWLFKARLTLHWVEVLPSFSFWISEPSFISKL